MKDFDELMARFDSVPEMPLSEETLGAYMEGTLPPDQYMIVDGMVNSDPELFELTNDLIADDLSAGGDGYGGEAPDLDFADNPFDDWSAGYDDSDFFNDEGHYESDGYEDTPYDTADSDDGFDYDGGYDSMD